MARYGKGSAAAPWEWLARPVTPLPLVCPFVDNLDFHVFVLFRGFAVAAPDAHADRAEVEQHLGLVPGEWTVCVVFTAADFTAALAVHITTAVVLCLWWWWSAGPAGATAGCLPTAHVPVRGGDVVVPRLRADGGGEAYTTDGCGR